MEKKRLFLDMDGVLADFYSKAPDPNKDLDFYNETILSPDFFLMLPKLQLLDDLMTHFNGANKSNLFILSSFPWACQVHHASRATREKMLWIMKHWPLFPVDNIYVTEKGRKHRFIESSNDFLIDDNKDYIDEWNRYGGTGRLYHRDSHKETLEYIKNEF